MTFIETDDRVTDPDEFVDVATLKRAFAAVQQAQQDRVRQGVAAFGDIDGSNNVIQPRVCVYDGRAVIPFLWHKLRGETTLAVRIRHTTPSDVTSGGTEMSMGAQALSLDEALNGSVHLTPSVTATVSNSASLVTTTLSLDVSKQGPGWMVVMVSFGASGEGSWADIEEGTGKPQLVVTSDGWTYGGIWVDTSTDDYSANEVPCQAVRIINNSSGDSDGRLPSARQLIRVEQLGTDFFLHVYPRIGTSSDMLADEHDEWYDPLVDYYQFMELGCIDLHSIELRTTVINAIPDASALLDGNQPASALAALSIIGASDEVYGHHTRIHHIGPSNDPAREDSLFSGEPLDRLGHSVLNDATWRTLAQTIVVPEDGFTLDGASYKRTTYDVGFLGLLTHTADDAGLAVLDFDISARLVLTDLDGTTSTVTSDEFTVRANSVTTPSSWRDPEGWDYPYLAGWYSVGVPGVLGRHALRGLWPSRGWAQMASAGFLAMDLSVKDTDTGTPRLLKLQVQGSAKSLNDTPFEFNKHVHLMTWTAMSTPLRSIDKNGGVV